MSNLLRNSIIGGTAITIILLLSLGNGHDQIKISDDIEFKTYSHRYLSMIEQGKEIQKQRIIEEQRLLEEQRLEQLRLEEQRRLEEEQKLLEEKRLQEERESRYRDFTLTFYTCLPSENSGYTTTAWGEVPTYGMVASNVYERGTQIYLEGYGDFVVADRGGSNFDSYNRLDIFIPRLDGESDYEYSQRVYSMGIVTVRGYIY